MNLTQIDNRKIVEAIRSQTIVAAAAAVNGTSILDPHKVGRRMSFILSFASLAGVTAFNATLQGSNDGGSTWSTVVQNDGSTAMALTGSKFIAGGAYSAAVCVASIDLARGKWKAYRLGNITCTGADVKVSAVAEIYDLFISPPASPNVDEFIDKILPAGSTW